MTPITRRTITERTITKRRMMRVMKYNEYAEDGTVIKKTKTTPRKVFGLWMTFQNDGFRPLEECATLLSESLIECVLENGKPDKVEWVVKPLDFPGTVFYGGDDSSFGWKAIYEEKDDVAVWEAIDAIKRKKVGGHMTDLNFIHLEAKDIKKAIEALKKNGVGQNGCQVVLDANMVYQIMLENERLRRKPDPETGLVPCGCGGKAKFRFGMDWKGRPDDSCFVICEECGEQSGTVCGECIARHFWNRAKGRVSE